MLAKFSGGFAALIVVIIALGFILSDRVTLEREIIINAPQEKVFALVSDFNEWNRWSPLARIDPDAGFIVSDGGHRMDWNSDHPKVGNGSQEISSIDPPSRVSTFLDFGDMGQAYANFTLSPMPGGATKVVWRYERNMRDRVPLYMKPVCTYAAFFMEGMLGPLYEEGLANLKREAETG